MVYGPMDEDAAEEEAADVSVEEGEGKTNQQNKETPKVLPKEEEEKVDQKGQGNHANAKGTDSKLWYKGDSDSVKAKIGNK